MTRRCLIGLFSVSTVDSAAAAQQRPPVRDSAVSDSAARDSMAARLQRAEAAIELLRQQLAIEATTVVRTRSRLQIELSARVLTNAFMTIQSTSRNSSCPKQQHQLRRRQAVCRPAARGHARPGCHCARRVSEPP
jgi:hypothetical protein